MKRIQFTIWRMLLMTAIVAVLLAVFSKQTINYRQSIACAAAIAKLGGTVSWNPEILENLVRDQTIARITDVHFRDPKLNAEDWKQLVKLPLRFGLQVVGPSFTAESLNALVGCRNLHYVVFWNESVSDQDVVTFQALRPDVEVMFGYPGDQAYRNFPPREN